MTFQDLNNHAVALLNSQQQQQQPPQQQQQEQEDGEIHDGNVGIIEDAITYFREALHHARATISFKGGSSNGGSATTTSSYIWRLGGGIYYGPTQKRGEMTNTESDTVLGLIMSSKSSNSTSCTTKKSYYRQHLFTRMFTIHHIEDDVAVVDDGDDDSSKSSRKRSGSSRCAAAGRYSGGGGGGGGNVIPHATIIFNLATIHMTIGMFGDSGDVRKSGLNQSYNLYQCCWKILHIHYASLRLDQNCNNDDSSDEDIYLELMALGCLNNMMHLCNELGDFDTAYQYYEQLKEVLLVSSPSQTQSKQSDVTDDDDVIMSNVPTTTSSTLTSLAQPAAAVDNESSMVVEQEEEQEEEAVQEVEVEVQQQRDELISNLKTYSILIPTKLAPAA